MDIISVLNDLPGLKRFSPAKKSAIKTAEETLGVTFAEDYRQYLRSFGFVSTDGIDLTGLAKANRSNVVTVTKMARELFEQFPAGMYVIAQDHPKDDSFVLQNRDGIVYLLDSENPPVKYADSLAEFLLNAG